METLDQVFKLVGALVVGVGGLSLIVYQAFKYLAVRWLDARFDERLQALKHEHEKEIVQLRFKISTLLDRATKLHQREFEVLPEAWSKLNDAFWNTRRFVSPMQSFPDIDGMSQSQQEEFIESCRLMEWEKAEIRQANKKNQVYQKHLFWHELNEAENKARDGYSHLIKNGIFINDKIRTKFIFIHDLIWKALVEHKINEEQDIRPRFRDETRNFLDEGEGLILELERSVHKRLWPEENGVEMKDEC